MRVIAFDIGTARVGVARSDPLGMLASPLQVYTRGDDPAQDARELARIAEINGAERIVVGLPVSLRGELEIAAQHTQQFVELLREHTAVEIVLWDERMTTAIAQRAMIEADVSRDGRKKKIDQVAATLILQSYLDAQPNATTEIDQDQE